MLPPPARMQHLTRPGTLVLVCATCGPTSPVPADRETTGTTGTGTTGEQTPTTGTGGPASDLPPDTCEDPDTCGAALLDILIVIDDSATMAEEQARFAAGVPKMLARIREAVDANDDPRDLDVHLMITTTDNGHPLCAGSPGVPARGAPIASACVDRLERFEHAGLSVAEACTAHCSPDAPAAPSDPFLAFGPDGDNVLAANDAADPVAAALACMIPQGIDGCGIEEPLETMLQALDPQQPWNTGARPFLRPFAPLAIVLLTDEEDCATLDARHFDPANIDDPSFHQFWEDVPGMPGVKSEPTSAVCWNAGSECVDLEQDGVYESCVAVDRGVLQPTARYEQFLADLEAAGKPVVMLAIAGVPPVTSYDPLPPYEPAEGGIHALVYRDWSAEDLAPGDPLSAAQHQFDLGIGPGCRHTTDGFAAPPSRILKVCESLDSVDDPNTPHNERQVRCVLESVCGDDLGRVVDTWFAGLLTPPLTNEPGPALMR